MESARGGTQSGQIRPGRLLRILGVGFGLAVTLGSTIGVGILKAPGTVASQLGNGLLIVTVWSVGAVYALLGTISVTELATSLPQAGGWYVYARRAFGDYAGFTVGWCNWVSYSTTLASVAIALGEYLEKLVPSLSGSAKKSAIVMLVAFSILHWMGLRLGSRAQEITSFATALGFIALVAACFASGSRTDSGGLQQATLAVPSGPSALFMSLVLSFQSIIFTFDGWYVAIYFAEEDRNPSRNLPRSMLSGVLTVIGIYMLINLALLHVLSLPQIAASPLAAADAARAIFGPRGGQIITALSFLSILSILNATLLENTRIMFALSRDNLFLSTAASVNRRGTPGPAMILSSVVGIILAVTGSFERLIAITAFFYVLMYGSGFVSLFVLRRREPGLPRSFRAWGYPWTPGIVLALSILFLAGVIISDTRNSLYAIVMLSASYPVYLLVKRLNKR